MPPILALVFCLLVFSSASAQDVPVARTHNNESPAGRLAANMLDVRLVARESRLFPEAADGPSVVVPAFGLEDGPPEVPGPFLRVNVGTRIHVTLRNDLTTAIAVHGLRSSRSAETPLDVPKGETREVTFVADEPGLHLYWASVFKQSFEDRDGRHVLLN